FLAGKSGLPDQSGVTAGIDEAGCTDADIAVTRRQAERFDPALFHLDFADDRAEQHLDAGFANGVFAPPGERNFVVDDDVVDALPVVDRAGLREIADDVLRR